MIDENLLGWFSTREPISFICFFIYCGLSAKMLKAGVELGVATTRFFKFLILHSLDPPWFRLSSIGLSDIILNVEDGGGAGGLRGDNCPLNFFKVLPFLLLYLWLRPYLPLNSSM